MAGDYGMRGEAAQRLMKGKKGAPPPDDDLGLPPEDELPPEEGAGGMGGLAALLSGGAGAPPPGEEPMPGEAPMEEGQEPPMPEEGAPPEPADLDTALGGVEGALEGMAPEAAEEIRVHLNAIREIAAQSGQQAPMMEEGMPPMAGAPPQPDGGAGAGASMMEPQA